MAKRGGAVHVSTHRRHYVGKDGVARDYETHLLRRSYRQDGKVRNETVANLSHLPADLIEMIRASLAGQAFVPAGQTTDQAARVTRSLPHGHVAAVHVSTHRRHYVGKDGVARDYQTHLLRRSYRQDGKVHNETVANLLLDATLAEDDGVTVGADVGG